jgi:peptidoglycan-associated lipoprotein
MEDTTMRSKIAICLLLGLVACGKKNKAPETPSAEPAAATTEGESAAKTPEQAAAAGAALQDVIYFDFDKSELDDQAKSKLNQNAEWLKEDKARTLTIEGHTDEVGTPEYNLGLGERRARATRDYLIALGVEESRVSVITYGEERPASDQDPLNRRSMFIATRK